MTKPNSEAQTATLPKESKERRQPDPELQQLARLDRLFAKMPPEQRARALSWLDSRYGFSVAEDLNDPRR